MKVFLDRGEIILDVVEGRHCGCKVVMRVSIIEVKSGFTEVNSREGYFFSERDFFE